MAGMYPAYLAYKPSGVEWLGNIPEGWKAARLKHTVEQSRQITYGIVQAGPNLDVGIPYIRPADMTDEKGIRDFSGLMRTSPQIASDYERSKIMSGDLVCSIGPSFGKVMLVPDALSGANLTQGTARIAIGPENSSKFIFWALRSPVTFQQWESSVGGATFRALNLGPLAETYLSLPPLPEQTQIAAFLDHETAKIDALIAKQERLIALLEEKRQAVISRAVTKGLNPDAPLRPSGIEWLGDVPAHWDVSRLGFFTSKIGSGKTPRGGSEVYETDGILFLRSQNVYNDGLRISGDEATFIAPSIHEEMQNTKVLGGDILLNITGGSIGRTCIVPEGLGEANVNQHVCIIRCNDEINRYLSTFLKADAIVTQVNLLQTGGNREGLNFEQIAKFVVCMPPAKERTEIVEYVDNSNMKFRSLFQHAQSAIALLKERRTALISAAVTGKIDVRDWQPPRDITEQDTAQKAFA